MAAIWFALPAQLEYLIDKPAFFDLQSLRNHRRPVFPEILFHLGFQGVEDSLDAPAWYRFHFAFLRGAARVFDNDWGMSICGFTFSVSDWQKARLAPLWQRDTLSVETGKWRTERLTIACFAARPRRWRD